MTDPRYLVRLDTLPPVSGAPTAYLCTECGAAWVGEPTCSNYNPDTGSVVECLDLSAPPERDGIPERLDALGWALAVLAKRIGVAIHSTGDLVPMGLKWSVHGPDWRYASILTPEDDGWEEYDHADRVQKRRIVAAALRKAHVQTESP